MNTVQTFKELIESGNKTGLHQYLGIKHYQNIDDFVKDYLNVIQNGDTREIFNVVACTDELFPRLEQDFEKNGIFYPPGGTIKKVNQKEDVVKITLSTLGGFKLSNNTETGGTPDFSLIFSLKEIKKFDVEKGDSIEFIGYTDNKLVLILKGNPLKVNNVEINEIYAVKLNKKIKDEISINTKSTKPKL